MRKIKLSILAIVAICSIQSAMAWVHRDTLVRRILQNYILHPRQRQSVVTTLNTPFHTMLCGWTVGVV